MIGRHPPTKSAPHAFRKTAVNCARSKLVVLAVEVGGKRYKAFQVLFGRDGSLFVSFPYFRQHKGILAAATIPANGHASSQVNLAASGKVTSHLVKYSHHPDGRAHFSQHGKIRTQIGRQAIPLDRQCGHIFSVLIQGIEGLDRANAAKDLVNSPKRTLITFRVTGSLEQEAIKFVGRWYSSSSLRLSDNLQPDVGPLVTAQLPNGRQQEGFLIASPYSNTQQVLFVTCETMPRFASEPHLLVFYGGFDHPQVMTNTQKDAGFLSFIYPASDFDALNNAIGSVDFEGVAARGLGRPAT